MLILYYKVVRIHQSIIIESLALSLGKHVKTIMHLISQVITQAKLLKYTQTTCTFAIIVNYELSTKYTKDINIKIHLNTNTSKY